MNGCMDEETEASRIMWEEEGNEWSQCWLMGARDSDGLKAEGTVI